MPYSGGYPDIPWLQVRNVGNLLRHEYHRLSDAVIRGVTINELGL
ncbi:hypothetical protein [Pararhizobium sp.]|nr:hypothetical protein [Pararhizobium sp.]MDO9415793.1 hypothetical protein [Pararhizobium sp.]